MAPVASALAAGNTSTRATSGCPTPTEGGTGEPAAAPGAEDVNACSIEAANAPKLWGLSVCSDTT